MYFEKQVLPVYKPSPHPRENRCMCVYVRASCTTTAIDLASGAPFLSFFFFNRRAAMHARPSIGMPNKKKEKKK